jgi:chromosome partitioning protein
MAVKRMITIGMQKGGVGKTTTATTLGYGLSQEGYRVLIVDTDPQGHVAKYLGCVGWNPNESGLFAWYINRRKWESTTLLPRPGNENLAIMPIDRAGYMYLNETFELNKNKDDTKLSIPTIESFERAFLEEIQRYHVVIFDTPPALASMTPTAAFRMSNLVIIPSTLDYGSASEIGTTIQIAVAANPNIIYRILPTSYEAQTVVAKDVYGKINTTYPGFVFPPIPTDTKVKESRGSNLTIGEYAPSSRAYLGYTDTKGRSQGGYKKLIHHIARYMEGLPL